jgi:hypothetical protein
VGRKFLGVLDGQALLDWEEAFIDGSFAPAKKGAFGLEKPKRGKGSKWMAISKIPQEDNCTSKL